MNTRAHWRIVAAAMVCLVVGVMLSHRLEPGVRVESVTLAGNTPALKFIPSGTDPHPVVLLAHGVTASKETLFRLGEALAAAGFKCFAVDMSGHGESRLSFSHRNNLSALKEVAKEIGPVDVFIGHSMGAGVGNASVLNGDLSPKLFIALGAVPYFAEHGPPLLLLAGRFEELIPMSYLKERTDARVITSFWSDHALEPYDPILVNAAVAAACTAVGKTAPAPPTAWILRIIGLIFGLLGAIGLMIFLPKLSPRLARANGLFVPAILIATVALTAGTWLGAAPQLPRLPLQIIFAAMVWLPLFCLSKLGWPRWLIPAISAVGALGGLVATIFVSTGFGLLALFAVIMTLLLFTGTLLGKIASYQGSRRHGDLAMAILIGYAVGQWIPKIF